MTSSLSTAAYLAATILFILCLGGLSHPETARRGNLYGVAGMAIAVLATVFGPHVTTSGLGYIVAATAVGARGAAGAGNRRGDLVNVRHRHGDGLRGRGRGGGVLVRLLRRRPRDEERHRAGGDERDQ